MNLLSEDFAHVNLFPALLLHTAHTGQAIPVSFNFFFVFFFLNRMANHIGRAFYFNIFRTSFSDS